MSLQRWGNRLEQAAQTATGRLVLTPTLFADLPAASAATNAVYFVADVGPHGLLLRSDGSTYRTENGTPWRRFGASYEVTPGVEMFPLSTTTPPAPTGATGTTALDSTIQWDGADTWKVVNQTISGNIAVTHNLATPLSAPLVAPTMFIPVYVPDYKSLTTIAITLSMGDTAYTNVFAHSAYAIGPSGHADKQRNGWHLIAIAPSDWTVGAGSPAWTQTINSIRFRFIKDAAGGNDGIAYFATPWMHKQSIGQLLLYADDVHRSFYLNALPIFDAYNLKVNLACASGWINNSTYMSEAMYLDAQARGHEICVHSINQIGVNVLTYADAIADVAANQAYVRDTIGAKFGYKHFVFANGRYWPNGSDRSDLSVINYMRDTLGIELARTTDDPLRATTKTTMGMALDTSKYNQLLLPETFPYNSGNTVSVAKAEIDNIVAQKRVGTWVQHHAGYNGTDALQKPAGIQEVAEYIADKVASGVLLCPTGEEFVRDLY